MSTKVASLAVYNLHTAAEYVDHFIVECYSDAQLLNKVGTKTSPPAASTLGGFNQAALILFDNLVYGTTYWLRAGVVAPVSGAITWSAPYSMQAGSPNPPVVTYSGIYTATPSGVSVIITPSSQSNDINHFDVYWNSSGTAPVVGQAPQLGNINTLTEGEFQFLVGGHAGQTLYVWVRAVNTSAVPQAWTSLGSFQCQYSTGGINSQNVLINPSFEQAPSQTSGDIANGWYVGWVDPLWAITRETTEGMPWVYSGTAALKVHTTPGYSVPANSYTWTPITHRVLAPCKPGELWLGSVMVRADQQGAFPAGISWNAGCMVNVNFSDGSVQSSYGFGAPMGGGWYQASSQVLIPNPSNKTVVSIQIYPIAILQNTTGSPITLSSVGSPFDVRFDSASLVRVSSDGEVVLNKSTALNGQGSLLPGLVFQVAVVMNDNTSGQITQKLAWNAQNYPRPDGSIMSINAGSAVYTTAQNSLAANTTYYYYPYINVSDCSIHFGNGDPSSGRKPPTSADGTSAMISMEDGHIPCFGGNINITSPATSGGSGGYGGGGGAICPEENEPVTVAGKGVIPIKDAEIGDYIVGRDFHTRSAVVRRVTGKTRQPRGRWQEWHGHLYTPFDLVWYGEAWVPTINIPESTIAYKDSYAVHISIEATAFDDQNYIVGEDYMTGDVVHNSIIIDGC